MTGAKSTGKVRLYPYIELAWDAQGYLLTCEGCGQVFRRTEGPEGYRQEDIHAGRVFVAGHREHHGSAAA